MNTTAEPKTRDCGKCSYCSPAPSDITHFHHWAPTQCENPVPVTSGNELISSRELAVIEDLVNSATEGPWTTRYCSLDCCVIISTETDSDEQIATSYDYDDASFMAHARTDLPAVIALARRQEEILQGILKLVEDSEEDRRVRQDAQPFSRLADSVIGTEELREVLAEFSERFKK